MSDYKGNYEKLTEFARADDRICAMVLFGSRARSFKTSDIYSDYDIILFVKDTDFFLNTDEWLESIAHVFISFNEPTAAGGYERRVFFDNAADMDFIFYNASDAETITNTDVIRSWYSRGYQIVVDKMQYAAIAEEAVKRELPINRLSCDVFDNLVQTFWFHAVWSEKKLLRGEIWAAKCCIDGYMKTLLRQMWDYRYQAEHLTNSDIWHDGRFLDERISPDEKSRLNEAYGQYSVIAIENALRKTMEMFSDAARQTARLYQFDYDNKAEEYACRQVDRLSKLSNYDGIIL